MQRRKSSGPRLSLLLRFFMFPGSSPSAAAGFGPLQHLLSWPFSFFLQPSGVLPPPQLHLWDATHPHPHITASLQRMQPANHAWVRLSARQSICPPLQILGVNLACSRASAGTLTRGGQRWIHIPQKKKRVSGGRNVSLQFQQAATGGALPSLTHAARLQVDAVILIFQPRLHAARCPSQTEAEVKAAAVA